tara:strand:+ start:348 stop:794 length:447 start_codon:yes stop_codon:yes gene_type:complete
MFKICPECNNKIFLEENIILYRCCDENVCSKNCSLKRYNNIKVIDPEFKKFYLWNNNEKNFNFKENITNNNKKSLIKSNKNYSKKKILIKSNENYNTKKILIKSNENIEEDKKCNKKFNLNLCNRILTLGFVLYNFINTFSLFHKDLA